MNPGRGPGVGIIVFLSCVFGLLAGVLGAMLYARLGPQPRFRSPTVVTTTSTRAASRPPISITTDEDAIVKAAAVAGPAAVKIETVHRRAASPWDLFLGTPAEEQRGIGSGFIFQFEGKKYVLTNTHVLKGPTGEPAKAIDIALRDGRTIEGKLAGQDASQDIACIALQGAPADTPTVELGDSDALEVGEWVLAIGNPFNFEHSVTVGVVSARGPRPIGESESRDLIQTDASINRGNSGGPLVNLAGQVVGINNMIYSGTGYSIGIGFAIPINQAKELLHYLVHRGPWVGVKMWANSRGQARFYDLPTHEGVVVHSVVRGGPASRAGVRPFDVVTHVDGQVVNAPEEMQRAIRKHAIGDPTTLSIVRDDGRHQISIRTGQLPDGYYG
ncbi:MAG: trypsin-like peptidase domain-containing protein [Armatimonadota bacterium]